MSTWSATAIAAPQLATRVRERIEAHGLGLLATIRRDGFPRISGVEPLFALDELWLGMMPGSRKAADLQRDPRFALHNATTDKQVTDGDVKITGRALLVEDEQTIARYLEAFHGQAGYSPPPGPFHLFRADVRDLSSVRPAGDHLDIEWWQEGGEVKRIERH